MWERLKLRVRIGRAERVLTSLANQWLLWLHGVLIGWG